MADPLSPVNFTTLLDSPSSVLEDMIYQAIQKAEDRTRLFQFGGDQSLSKGRKILSGKSAPLDRKTFQKNYACTVVDSGFVCLMHLPNSKNFDSRVTIHEFALVDIQAGTKAIPAALAAAAAKATVGLGLKAVSMALGGGSGLIPVARSGISASTKFSTPHISPSDLQKVTKAESRMYRYLSKIPGLRGPARRKHQDAEGILKKIRPQVQALEGVQLLVNVVTPAGIGNATEVHLGGSHAQATSVDWARVHPGRESLLRIGRADRNVGMRISALLQASGNNTPASAHIGHGQLFDDTYLFAKGFDTTASFPIRRRAINNNDPFTSRAIASNSELKQYFAMQNYTLGGVDTDDFFGKLVGGGR